MTRHDLSQEESAINADVESNGTSDAESTLSEHSPLLPNDLPPEIVPSKTFQRKVLLMCTVTLFIVTVSAYIMEPPLQNIMEDIICRKYFPDHTLRMPRIQDHRCKNTEVQKSLAMLRGWGFAMDMSIPIIAQLPFGVVADKYGRRIVLFLALLGCSLQAGYSIVILLFPDVFPIWAILFGSLFFLIGGGGTMVAAMVWTIIADVIPVTERTAIFYRISAVVLSFNVVVNPVAAFLLKIDPWLGMWLGFGFFIVGTLSTFLIPETLELRQKADQRSHEQSPLNSERDERQEEEENFSKRGVLKQAWFSLQNDLGHIWRFIFASKSILILLFAFAVFFPIRLAYLNILLQYMTKRFEWDWSKATYISTVGNLATITCLLAILPGASALITKYAAVTPVRRDLWLMRATIICTAIGSLLMAMAAVPWLFIASLIIVSFGTGFATLCRAILNAVVEPHTVAILNTTLSLVEMLTGFIGGPAMGWLLSRGMEMGGAWLGLPFLVAFGLAVIVSVAVFYFQPPQGVAQAHEE